MWKTCTERLARSLVVPLVASLALVTSTAGAQVVNEETARVAFTEGLRLRDREHKPEEALPKLKAAHDLAVTARTGYELAKTYLLLGSLVEAQRLFLEVTRLQPDPVQSAAGKNARDESNRLAVELDGRIPALVVRLTGASAAGAEVYIDSTRVPEAARSLSWKANPGAHAVVVKVQGEPDRSRSVTLVEGTTESVDIDLTPVATAPPVAPPTNPSQPGAAPTAEPSQGTPASEPTVWTAPRIAAVTVGGAGVVAVAVGGVLALSAKSSFDSAKQQQCGASIGAPSDSLCSTGGVRARESAGSQADAATVVMAAGGAALAAGVIIWLVAPKSTQPDDAARTGIALGASPGSMFVWGAF